MSHSNQSNFNITNQVLNGSGLSLNNCSNVVISNCNITNVSNVAIFLQNCSNILIHSCYFENVWSGVYAVGCTGGIKAVCNGAKNMTGGKHPDGSTQHRGQFFQYNGCSGPQNYIGYNWGIDEDGKSFPEDHVNIYKTSGTGTSPIIVEYNYFEGGLSNSGSGIMFSNSGGSWQVVQNNTLNKCGQAGIGMCGGTELVAQNNNIYSSQTSVSNVGLYVWNQSPSPSSNFSVINNRVNWVNKHGSTNGFYNNGNVSNVTVSGNNFNDTSYVAPTLTQWLATLTSIPYQIPLDASGHFVPPSSSSSTPSPSSSTPSPSPSSSTPSPSSSTPSPSPSSSTPSPSPSSSTPSPSSVTVTASLNSLVLSFQMTQDISLHSGDTVTFKFS